MRTQARTGQIEDGGVTRDDLNTATAGKAVVRKIVQGTDISITSDGADAGTGDVIINAGANVLNTTNAKTLTNKRNQKRVFTDDTLATLTPEIDTADIFVLTAQDQALTIANPSTSTMAHGEMFLIEVKDDGTPRAISYGDKYEDFVEAKAATTVADKWLWQLWKWNEADEKLYLAFQKVQP